MRIFGLGCLLFAGVMAGGCFQMTTVVKVNGDGSGTIDHSMLVTKAALAQLRGMAGLAGRSDRPQIDITSEDQARAMAIRAAKEKATLLASEIGQTIGPAYSITEDSNLPANGRVNQNASLDSFVSGDASESAIAPGSLSITARVTVRFRLQ